MYFNVWNYDVDKYKKTHFCCALGGVSSTKEAVMRRLKHLAEVLKRLTTQLAVAKTPNEKNSIQIRIEQVQAEIAMLERELNT